MKDDVKRSRPWIRIVFAISIALNLLVAGVVLGGLYKFHTAQGDRMVQMGGPLTRALSPEDRSVLRRQLRQALRNDAPRRATYTALVQAMITDLRAERYDGDVMAAHFAEQRRLLNERVALGHSLLLERLEQMTAAERTAIADRLEEGMGRVGTR